MEDSLVDLKGLAVSREALQKALVSSQDSKRLSQERYDKGLSSYLEVVEAERTVLRVELVLAQSGSRPPHHLRRPRQSPRRRLDRQITGPRNSFRPKTTHHSINFADIPDLDLNLIQNSFHHLQGFREGRFIKVRGQWKNGIRCC